MQIFCIAVGKSTISNDQKQAAIHKISSQFFVNSSNTALWEIYSESILTNILYTYVLQASKK